MSLHVAARSSPVVRAFLLASLSNDSDDVPLERVAALIEEDTITAGEFSGRRELGHDPIVVQICSIRQAVNRLGIGPLL